MTTAHLVQVNAVVVVVIIVFFAISFALLVEEPPTIENEKVIEDLGPIPQNFKRSLNHIWTISFYIK